MQRIVHSCSLFAILVCCTGFVPASLAPKPPVVSAKAPPAPQDTFIKRVNFLSRVCPRIHPQRVGIGLHYSLQSIVARASREHQVPESLIYSVIAVESTCNARAISRAGARGMMQLMPRTARWLGVVDSLNAEQNILGGTKYLAHLLRRFDGDVTHAIAAYNAGPRNVVRYNGIPPFGETQQYVVRVNSMRQKFIASVSRDTPVADNRHALLAPQPTLPNL